jgi:hypothetical protein
MASNRVKKYKTGVSKSKCDDLLNGGTKVSEIVWTCQQLVRVTINTQCEWRWQHTVRVTMATHSASDSESDGGNTVRVGLLSGLSGLSGLTQCEWCTWSMASVCPLRSISAVTWPRLNWGVIHSKLVSNLKLVENLGKWINRAVNEGPSKKDRFEIYIWCSYIQNGRKSRQKNLD